MAEDFYRELQEALARIEAQGTRRALHPGDYRLPVMEMEGRKYLNLSSNDYLGIANDAGLTARFLSGVNDCRFGSAGSRLMTGNTGAYRDFERMLEQAYGRPALVFGSGYHANTGILPALAHAGDLILADRLVHASILDGILACKADYRRFRHNDYEHLESLLAKDRDRYRRVWIVTESIFSMDGDRCDLPTLVGLKRRYGALLYVDEAHSVGTDGPDGLGMCVAQGLLPDVDIAVYPMGKAVASHGAFVLCRETLRDYLVNVSRPLIFSTALPPVCVEWSHFVFREFEAMSARRSRLRSISAQVRAALRAKGFQVLGDSHIIPVVFGENRAALDAADRLRGQGIWATAIRHPTVAKGQARIRLSISSAFSDEETESVIEAFGKL